MNQKAPFWSICVQKTIDSSSFWLPPIVASAFLLAMAQRSFLSFHTLAELFSIIISFVMFAVAWSTDRYRKNAFLIFLACGYFWIGSLDLAHTLVYKGMNIVVEGSGNLSTQFWVGTRYGEALLLLTAPFVIHRNFNRFYLFLYFGCAATILYWAIVMQHFPITYIEDTGLTPFKIYSEFVIIGTLVLALGTLRLRRHELAAIEFKLIAAAIVLTIAEESLFSIYVHVYDVYNLAGHLFKVISCWMIFQAVVLINLKRPYEELAESRDYNRQLFDTTTLGLALTNMDGTLLDINPAYANIIGRSVDETLGLTYWDITPDKYADAEQEQLKSLTTSGRYGPYQKEYIHKDGHLVPVQLSGSLILHNGEPCIWSSVEDISARVATEYALTETVERIHKLATHLPGFIYQFRLRPDGTSHFPYASQGIHDIYGCAPEDVVHDASPVFAVLHPDDLERVSQSIRHSAETLTVWTDEYRVNRPDGWTIWVEGHATPTKEGNDIVWHGYIQDVSARIDARHEIIEQRDRLRNYLDLAGTLVVAIDRDGKIILINRFASELLGYDENALMGRNWFDVAIPPTDRSAIIDLHRKNLNDEHQKFSKYENELLTNVGERRLIAWNNVRLDDAEGNAHAILSSGIDVTDERLAQQALERSNRALRTISHCNEVLVHATSEGQLLKSICRVIVEEGGYQMAWTAFVRYDDGSHFVSTALYGITQDVVDEFLAELNSLELQDSSMRLLCSVADSPSLMPDCKALCDKHKIASLHMLPLKDQGVLFGGLFIARGDGNDFDQAEWDLLAELASDLAYGVLSLRMERERTYAMDKLAESEERSLAIVESAHDAIVAINHKGKITQLNPAAQAMFGHTLHEALGKDVDIIIPERFRKQHHKSVSQFAKTRKGHIFGKSMSLSGLRSNGKEFPIELTLSPMPGSSTDLCTAFIRDVSDREEAERQRRQAQNMESLGNLAGGMAHDINNMLLPILNLTAMVQRTLEPQSKEEKKLGMVLQAAERVQGLVRRVLEFSRQDDPEYKDQDIHRIIEGALPLIRSTTPSSIEIKTNIQAFPGVIHADEKQINAALINLVNNASDAIAGHNGHIMIALKQVKPGQTMLIRNPALRAIPYAKISVTDDGSGMSPQVLERIFDPFFTTKEPGKGTGLGMSMVHGIVTKLGGAVDVHSIEGKGTRIDLYIPLKQQPIKHKPKTHPA